MLKKEKLVGALVYYDGTWLYKLINININIRWYVTSVHINALIINVN